MEPDNQLIIPDLSLVAGENNKKLCTAVLNMFETVPQGMTAFQIHNFVLSGKDFPTPDSKWWQAKLELWVRLQNVIQMHYDHRKRGAKKRELLARTDELEDKIAFAGKSYERAKYSARSDILQVEIEENDFAMVLIQKSIGDKLGEMRSFRDAMEQLEGKMQFSKEDKEEQEATFWTAKSNYDAELARRFPEIFLADEQKP